MLVAVKPQELPHRPFEKHYPEAQSMELAHFPQFPVDKHAVPDGQTPEKHGSQTLPKPVSVWQLLDGHSELEAQLEQRFTPPLADLQRYPHWQSVAVVQILFL